MHLRDQDRLHWKSNRSSYSSTSLLLYWPSTVPLGDIFPESLVPPAQNKNSGRTTSAPPSLGSVCGSPCFGLPPWGLQGNLQGSASAGMNVTEKRREHGNYQHAGLGWLSSYQRCPGSNPHQQMCSSRKGHALLRELRRKQASLIQILR